MPSPLARSLVVLAAAVTLLFAAPAAAQAYWGAVAVDPVTGATGLSYTQGSAHAAPARARNDCGQAARRRAHEQSARGIVWIFSGLS